jgi:ubiquinone/menaquinone biosynthesis C-methylase UbiE
MIAIYYRLVRLAYEKVFGQQQMLHYPLYKEDRQSLMEGQIHFTNHCLSKLPDLRKMRLLDIGCGNGVQTIYIHQTYQPQYVCGVDISEMHIKLATAEKEKRNLRQIDFAIANAQSLSSIDDNSFDAAICTESAHHYPDKEAFLGQVKRVLRPGGYFLIADLLRRDGSPPSRLDKKFMMLHWSRQKYRDAMSKLQLVLVSEEDLTDLIISGFKTADSWFAKPPDAKPLHYYFGKLFGRMLIKLYMYQLKHSLQYCLIIGKK